MSSASSSSLSPSQDPKTAVEPEESETLSKVLSRIESSSEGRSLRTSSSLSSCSHRKGPRSCVDAKGYSFGPTEGWADLKLRLITRRPGRISYCVRNTHLEDDDDPLTVWPFPLLLLLLLSSLLSRSC
jgi:hypothetical protein